MHDMTSEQYDGLWSFIVEACAFTDEQNKAIEHQIPMTQEIFDSIIDKCIDMGSEVEPLFIRMNNEYKEMMDIYLDTMMSRINESLMEQGLYKESTPEEIEAGFKDLMERIQKQNQ